MPDGVCDFKLLLESEQPWQASVKRLYMTSIFSSPMHQSTDNHGIFRNMSIRVYILVYRSVSAVVVEWNDVLDLVAPRARRVRNEHSPRDTVWVFFHRRVWKGYFGYVWQQAHLVLCPDSYLGEHTLENDVKNEEEENQTIWYCCFFFLYSYFHSTFLYLKKSTFTYIDNSASSAAAAYIGILTSTSRWTCFRFASTSLDSSSMLSIVALSSSIRFCTNYTTSAHPE